MFFCGTLIDGAAATQTVEGTAATQTANSSCTEGTAAATADDKTDPHPARVASDRGPRLRMSH